jgi:hypothetical protein
MKTNSVNGGIDGIGGIGGNESRESRIKIIYGIDKVTENDI